MKGEHIMTKFQPAFEGQARCEYKKGTVHRCTVGTSAGEKFCTQHKPVVTIDPQGDSRTTTTKEESIMNKKGLLSTIKATVTSVKESKFVKWVKRQASALATKKAAIAIGSFSAVVGGIVTASCGTALAVGAAVAALITAAAHAMTKKKEQSLSYKAMLSDMGVAVATVAAMPAVLFVAAYVGLYATVYGAILPYAIIVA